MEEAVVKISDQVMSRDCLWYLEPQDRFTNDMIAAELPGVEAETISDKDGREHTVFPCPVQKVTLLQKAARRSKSRFDYRVFNRRGDGQFRRVAIFEPGFKPKSKEKPKV